MTSASPRSVRGAAPLALCAAAALAGCASRIEAPHPAAVPAAQAALNLPRSERGNPPFYEVQGRRYYVLATSAGYDRRGVASWYGPDFHKQATSSGETYDMYGMTAAHKTLPLPTWVEVTNLANGKRVIVKVNDRGPFVKNRLIDLSYAAAKKLDMIGAGTARVEVRALGAARSAGARATPGPAPAPRPALVAQQAPAGRAAPRRAAFSLISEAQADELAAADRAVPAPGGDEPLFIQVGAFSERANALRVVARLKGRGYANAFVVRGSDDSLNRVRIGPLVNVAEYDRVNAGLHSLGFEDTRLVADGRAAAADRP